MIENVMIKKYGGNMIIMPWCWSSMQLMKSLSQVFWIAKLLQQCGEGYLWCMNRVQGRTNTYSNNISLILPWNLIRICLVSFLSKGISYSIEWHRRGHNRECNHHYDFMCLSNWV
jgi:hypothetical protein